MTDTCLRRATPPAELLQVEPEPVADGDTLRAALGLIDPLRAWGRRCYARTGALIEWAEPDK